MTFSLFASGVSSDIVLELLPAGESGERANGDYAVPMMIDGHGEECGMDGILCNWDTIVTQK